MEKDLLDLIREQIKLQPLQSSTLSHFMFQEMKARLPARWQLTLSSFPNF